MVTDRGALSGVTGSRPRRRGSQCVRSRTVIRQGKTFPGSERPSPTDEREDPIGAIRGWDTPSNLAERPAPRSRDQVVIFGGHLVQLIGAIAVIYAQGSEVVQERLTNI